MAVRPYREFENLKARGPRSPGKEVGNSVALHEAIILCMVREGKYTMSLRKLVRLNKEFDLYRRPTDGKFPEYNQLRARIGMVDYLHLFSIDQGPKDQAKVSLRKIGDAEALKVG